MSDTENTTPPGMQSVHLAVEIGQLKDRTDQIVMSFLMDGKRSLMFVIGTEAAEVLASSIVETLFQLKARKEGMILSPAADKVQ